MDRRPCCRPSSAHAWEELPGDANYATCPRCGRLAYRQRGGRLGSRGQLKLVSCPATEAHVRERAGEGIASGPRKE